MPRVCIRKRAGRGFTLAELLVVIGIIILLVAILIPVLGRVRQSARVADTQNRIASIQNAIDRYYMDFRAYPGIFSNDQINTPATYPLRFGPALPLRNAPPPNGDNALIPRITMAENLVLSLLGGLRVDMTGSTPTGFFYDRTLVGSGAMCLNLASPKRYPRYLDLDASSDQLSRGRFVDSGGIAASDSIVPEFVDAFPDPLPILYLRARAGTSGILTFGGQDEKSQPAVYQYDLAQIIAYTAPDASGTFIGGRRHGINSLLTANNDSPPLDNAPPPAPPYCGLTYFMDPQMHGASNAAGTPRQKDTYILISPGPDRAYGTADDICSFGSVMP